MTGNYKVITLCGSTRFKDDFLRVQKELTLEGNIVIPVGLFGHSGDDEVWTEGTKRMLDDMHLAKIDMADEIFVVNPNGYVGDSTSCEIAYAIKKGKAIRSLVPIHLDRFKGEEGFSPNLLAPTSEAGKLAKAQWLLSGKVWNRAIEKGLMKGVSDDFVWPIYDGVSDPASYLSSNPKVMFVLKEPYDETRKDENGKTVPYGGGWDFPRLLKKWSKDRKWPIRTWQSVIYAMYGFRNGRYYNQMDYISEKPEMGDVLLSTCWINLSKMPGLSSSSNGKWKEAFRENWKDIFKEQVNLYKPDVIVFGGTFDSAWDCVMDSRDGGESVFASDGGLSLTKYMLGDRLVLAAAHPGIRYNKDQEFWVNSIIDALREYDESRRQLPR